MLVSFKCFFLWTLFLCWAPRVLAVREPRIVQESGIPEVGQLLSCPSGCTCANPPQHGTVLDCRDRGLSNVPNTLPNATTKLFLDRNALQAFDKLGPVPALEVVTLTHNSISNLPSDAFQSLPRLKQLDLSANRLSDHLPDSAFRGLAYLQYLNLSTNSLSNISELLLQGLDSLLSLDLSRNILSQMDRDSFRSLTNLELLDVSHNKLSHLQEEWFYGLGNLKKLDLSHNTIQNVNNQVFWSLKSLKNLDLSHNVISRVGQLSFKGLKQVLKLDLSHNNIARLREGTASSMNELQEVDLSHNPLENFDGTFKMSQTIVSLKLDHTERLRNLTANSLKGLSGLTHLHVSHSALTLINPKAFDDMTNLRELHLSMSQLRSLPGTLFNSLSILEYIYLQGNPWHCDCLLHWLLRWLKNHKGLIRYSSDTLCQTPQRLHNAQVLEALDHHMTCRNASAEPINIKPDFLLGSDAMLSCSIKGYPEPSLTWVTPRNVMLHVTGTNSSVDHPSIHGPGGGDIHENDIQRFELLPNGSLKVKHVGRMDTGVYRCIASNALSNSTAEVSLLLNGAFVQDIKFMSIWVGLATSAAFLLLTLVGQFVSWVMGRCGWECPCCNTHKGQQLWRVLENMESYKSQQLERLRENYNNQVQKIKDNCMQQMEWLRESYSCQVERLRDIRDYGTQQIDRIRDNYYSQVQKVRDYSTSQIDRLRENYIFQRTRIRKFSAHQLLKLRENYKLQQQHLNKILENLNLDNCKANCSRTDSMIFESPELAIQPAFHNAEGLPVDLVHLHLDYAETGSQISAYFTPNDSSSETSSSISIKNQPHWEPKLLVTPRKKRAKSSTIKKMDVASSTTDLHVYQSNSSSDCNPISETVLPLPVEELKSCATVNQATLPNTSPCHSKIPVEDVDSPDRYLPENDSSMGNEQQLALPLHNNECTLGQQLSEYSNRGSEDLNHLQSIECHSSVTSIPQETVNETIV